MIRFFTLLISLVCFFSVKAQDIVYLQSNSSGYYWGQTGNQNALNDVFGAGNWQDLKLETVNVASILKPEVKLIFIDGSNTGTCSFITFLDNHHAALESWVNAGGTLILNAAPNACTGNINLYFGSITSAYGPSGYGTIVNNNHPVFQKGSFQPSVAVQFTGSSLSHNYLSGPGMSNILLDQTSRPILSEKVWGSGRVIFGGLTLALFNSNGWAPQPNLFNMYRNLLQYATNFYTVTSITTSSLASNILCKGASVNISYTINGTFLAGNTFTAQLSDASGSFASPVNIGSISATTNGTINATIPAGTNAGSGYKIRVVSSNPAITGTDNGANITINALPLAEINGTARICQGATLTLSATAVPGATYSWTGPNGFSSTSQDISINNASLAVSGNYSVTVNANGCSSTATTSVTVDPVYPVTTTGAQICSGQTATLTANSTGGVIGWYDASTGGNLLATGNTFITPALTTSTKYYASATLVNDLATTSAGGNNQSGNMFNITALKALTISGFDIYQANAANTRIRVYYRAGGYAGFENNESAWTLLGSATVSGAQLTPVKLAVGGLTIPAGQTYGIYITAEDGNYISYTDGANTYADANMRINTGVGIAYPFGNVYNPRTWNGKVYYTSHAGNSCPSPRQEAVATVNPLPVAAISGNNTVCEGGDISLTATAVSGATYSWTGPNGFTATTQNISINNAAGSNAGTYTLTVSANGCSSTATTDVIVNALPASPAITAGGATTFCAGGDVTLSTIKEGGYQWYKNGDLINGATNQSYIATATGSYTVEVTNGSGCKLVSAATPVTVNPLVTPSVSISASTATTILMNTNVTFTATPVNGGSVTSYQWKKNGVNIDNATTSTYTTSSLANNDKISCEITSTATCASPATVISNVITITVLLPAVTVNGALNGFSQIIGSVSNTQNFSVSGTNIVSNISISAPAGFQLSLNGTNWSSSLTLSAVNSILAATTITVRLNAATAGAYAGNITIATTGVTTLNIPVSGTAVLPTVAVIGTLNSFNQIVGSVSALQNFNVIGGNLLADQIITAPAGYELSLDGATWSNSVTLTPVNNTVSATNISVRLNATTAGNYAGDISIVSSGAITQNLSVSGTAVLPALTVNGLLNSFSQIIGSVSATQNFSVNGSNLLADAVITAPAGYELSLDGSTWSNVVTLPAVSNTVSNTMISIRLNAATAGNYAGDITVASIGAAIQSVQVSGIAVQPALSVNGTPANFFQIIGSVSATQTFTVSGANLLNDITVTAPAGYQLSIDGSAWNGSVTLTTQNNTVAPTSVSIRLNASVAGAYSGDITIISSNAVSRILPVTGTAVLPALSVNGSMSNFKQIIGSVSATQTFTVSGNHLLNNAVITAPAGYELSLNGTTWNNSISVTPVNNIIAAITVSVRLQASVAGNYAGNITITSSGAASKTIAVSGIAVLPTLEVNSALSNLTQVIGSASPAQTFTVGGTNLLGTITVTAPTGYELSANGSSWSNSVSFTPANNIVGLSTISVRLNATVANSYAGNITIVSSGAASASVPVSGIALPTPVITLDGSGMSFTQHLGSPSPVKTYQVSGKNLLDKVTLTPPVGFELSVNGTVWYQNNNPLILPQTGGNLANTIVYVRLNSNEAKSYSGDIAHATLSGAVVNLATTGINYMTLKISPNPVSAGTSQITVWHPQLYTVANLTLYTLNGVKMGTYQSQAGSTSTRINVQHLPAGLYFIEFRRLDIKQVFKFIKE